MQGSIVPADGAAFELRIEPDLARVPAAAWDALVGDEDPFCEHAFLHGLALSGSVGGSSGWTPRHLLAFRRGELVGAVPLYRKDHSYGEFVCDFAWANASLRAGLPYYPKLVAAVPFTPVAGRRLLVRPGAGADGIAIELARALPELARSSGASGAHVLFCSQAELPALEAAGLVPRLGFQFHWANRAPASYRDFADYLGAMKARHRKQIRNERARAAAHGLTFVTRAGAELSPPEWRALESFYRGNVDRHNATAYLTPAFFAYLRERLAHRVVATLALRRDAPVAGALAFEKGGALYGRYWGAREPLDALHFELCYHRLIERAIARGHRRFEAGAQGEHKLKRGLVPVATFSAHFLCDPELAAAVRRFLAGETESVRAAMAAYGEEAPFRAGAA